MKPIAELDARWRVVDAGQQWILQVRSGRPTALSTGWRGRAYCTQRTSLLRCIREYFGEVDTDLLRVIEALPERYLYKR